MDDILRRVERLEARDDAHDDRIGKLDVALAKLQTKWENQETRSAHQPAWVGIIVAAAISLFTFVAGLLATGLRP